MGINQMFPDYPRHVLDKFKSFHQQNPRVFQDFKSKAFAMRSKRNKYSAMAIFQAMRWDYDLQTSGDPFKINNDFIPIYARLLVYHHPEFETFFEFRKVISKGIGSAEQHERDQQL